MPKIAVPPLALFIFFSVVTSACQDRDPKWSRFTLGGQLSILNMPHFVETSTDAGFGGHFEIHFSPRLSLRSQFDYWPQNHLQTAQDGGNTLAFSSGVKANFIQHRRFAIYGEMRPGIVSFSNVPIQISAFDIENQRKTHFTLNLGGGVEYYASTRTVVHFSLTSPLVEIHSRTLHVADGIEIGSPGRIRPSLQASAGIGYRLGTMRETMIEVTESGSRKWEVGPQLCTQDLERAPFLFSDVRNELGFGGVGSYRLTERVALDGSFLFFPKDYRVADFQDGGRITQVLAGLRAGRQFGRLGIWMKARPGFQRYSLSLSDFIQFPSTNYSSVFHFALDLGGVLEFPISRRTALRLDASDVMRFHRETQLKGVNFSAPSARYDTIQFSTAWLWKF